MIRIEACMLIFIENRGSCLETDMDKSQAVKLSEADKKKTKKKADKKEADKKSDKKENGSIWVR